MPFSNTTFAKASFKFALGIAHTSNAREFYSESDVSAFVIASQNIWSQNIDVDPSTAQANSVVSEELSLHVEKIPGYSAYYAKLSSVEPVPTTLAGKINPVTGNAYQQGDRVGHIIPRLFGEDYLAELRDPNIAPTSPNNIISYGHASNWFIDPFAGIITQENELLLTTDARLVCRVYTGELLADNLERLQSELDAAVISGGSVTPTMLQDVEDRLQTQIDSLSAAIEQVADGDVTTTELAAVSGYLDNRIDENFSLIQNNTTLIIQVSGDVVQNASDIDNLQDQINTISASGGAVTPGDIQDLQYQIDDNANEITNVRSDLTTDIQVVSAAVDINALDISSLQNNISDLNNIDISLQNQIWANESNILEISGQLGPGLTTADSRINALSASVEQNTNDISQNVSNIAALQAELDAAIISGGSVSQSQITDLQTQIDALSGANIERIEDSATLSISISSNESDINTLQADVINNSNLISDNSTNITNLENSVSELITISAGLDNQISQNTTYIIEISGDVIQNINDIDQLRTDLDNVLISGGAVTPGDLEGIQTQIDSLSGAIDDNTVTIESLSERVSANEVAIVDLEAGSSARDNAIADLDDRVTNIEEDYSTSSDLNALSGSLKNDYQSQIDSLVVSGGYTGLIGPAEDGDYTDGLFVDFTTTTPVGTAVDRFNEVLALFAPPSPPALSSKSSNTGESGKVSFDSTNEPLGYDAGPLTINELFNTTSPKRGIFNGLTTLQGTLADNVSAHSFSYPANSFSDGDKGTLELIVNGITIVSTDLVTALGGEYFNGNGSGFVITEATPIEFENGRELPQFKYRTGTWKVVSTDQQNGYNTIQVKHTVGGTPRLTQEFQYLNDAKSGSNVELATHNFVNLNMDNIQYLSGVKYHTTGSVDYQSEYTAAYQNTYSTSNITFTEINCDFANQSIPSTTGPTDTIDLDINGLVRTTSRILGDGLSVMPTVPKTLGRGAILSTLSDFELLLDPFINNMTGTTDERESFNTESYRMTAELYANQTNLRNISYSAGSSSSPFTWDSTANIVVNPYHNDGLLQYDGKIVYPSSSQVVNSGNFSAVVDGPLLNANYSLQSNTRIYLRYFYFSGDSKSNFSLKLSRDGTTGFNSVATGPSGQNVTVELLLPNGTTDTDGLDNTIGNVEFKDPTIAFQTTREGNVGCGWDSNKQSLHDFGVNFGRRGTHMSGGVVIVRVKASSSWTGYISDIELVDV